MSWFARSIANSLQLNINDDEETSQHPNTTTTTTTNSDQKPEQQQIEEEEDDDSLLTPGRGVKEDLSEITKTLTRQFWGVASFLAPPPPAESEQANDQSDSSDPEEEDDPPEAISGIRRDFAEIGGRFRSGISKLSTNIDVSEITKLASNFLQLSPDGDDYVLSRDAQAIGVTDEVVAFVRDITMHPETWLDFPLPDEDEDEDEDFELSDAQQEHALTVERMAPRLAALRIELCPGYISESSFWKIYFVLLHPRLEAQAAELLSTPEIVKARAALKHELKDRSNTKTQTQPKEEESSRNNFPYSEQKPDSSLQQQPSVPLGTQSESVPLEASSTQSAADEETEKHQIPSEEIQVVDKSVIQETKTEEDEHVVEEEEEDDDDDDDWLKEEDNSENITGTTTAITTTTTTTTTIPIENDEDVSFSDLEEDDDAPTNYKKSADGSDSSTKDSRDWVQLGSDSSTGAGQTSGARNSETKESNDWLDVDDIDVA